MDKRKNLIERFRKDYKMEGVYDLLENVSPMIRRRLNLSSLPSIVEVVVEHFFPAPCEFSSYEFIENVASKISDIIVQNVGKNLTVREQNSLTVYLINEFADYLRDYYKTKCSRSLQSNESLMENVSPEIRRRIDSENLKDLIDYIVEYDFNAPCEYPVGEFVAEVCDLAVNNIVDYVVNGTSLQKVTFKDRDSLYYFFVDTFGDYLSNLHKKNCNNLTESEKKLWENVSPEIRRRLGNLNFDKISSEILNDYFSPCEYDNARELVGDVCDFLKNIVVEKIEEDGVKIDTKQTDALFYYFVDTYGKLLVDYHKKKCNKLKESKKKIIVTESQYKRLIEQKSTKIEVFQNLIDKSLDYIGQFCNESLSAEDYAGDIGFDSCDFLETIDGIKIDKLEVGQVGGSNSSNELVKPKIFIHLYLTINYHTIGTMTDFDGILYDIKTFLRKKTGVDVIFTYTTHNLNTNKNW